MAKREERKPKDPKPQAKPTLDKEALQAKIRAQFKNVFGYEDAPRARRIGPKSD